MEISRFCYFCCGGIRRSGFGYHPRWRVCSIHQVSCASWHLQFCAGADVVHVIRQTWRSTFYFSTALAVVYLALGWFSIDEDYPLVGIDRRIDWLGAFLVTAGLVMIVFVLGEGGVVGWATPCSSLSLLVLFSTNLSNVR